MAEQLDLLQLFQAMGERIAGLSTTMGAQGVVKVIKTFDGDSKQNSKNG